MNWPFENDNSAIVKKLAERGLFKNKTRNMAAILAISLTAYFFLILMLNINAHVR